MFKNSPKKYQLQSVCFFFVGVHSKYPESPVSSILVQKRPSPIYSLSGYLLLFFSYLFDQTNFLFSEFTLSTKKCLKNHLIYFKACVLIIFYTDNNIMAFTSANKKELQDSRLSHCTYLSQTDYIFIWKNLMMQFFSALEKRSESCLPDCIAIL